MPSPDVLSQAKAVLTAKNLFVEGGLPASLVGRLAQVKGAKSQSAIVAMFCRAAREYDDGHRPDERTTMDVMLDKVFPNYGSAALLKLLQLATLARELGPRLFAEQYWPASRALMKHLNDLPFPLFADLACQCMDVKADVYGLAPVIGFLFLRDPAQAAAWVEQAATTDAIAASLSKVIGCVLRWSEQPPHDPGEYYEHLRCSRKASSAMTIARRKLDERDPSRRADALSKESSDLFDKADAKRFGDAVARWAVLAKEPDQAHRSRVDNNARRYAVRRLWAKLTTETLAAEVRYGLATPGCDTYGTGDAFTALCLRDFPAAQALVREAGRAAMKDVVDAAIEGAQLDADGVNGGLAKRPELVEKVKTMPPSP